MKPITVILVLICATANLSFSQQGERLRPGDFLTNRNRNTPQTAPQETRPEVKTETKTNQSVTWEEEKSVEVQVKDFIKNPAGLGLKVGFSRLGYSDIWGLLSPWNTNNFEKLLLERAGRMSAIQLGFELGHSYVNLRISTYFPGTTDILYIEAETGVWEKTLDEYKRGLFYNIGVQFTGSLISFKTPLIDPANITNYSPTLVEQFNSGIGIAYVASGIPSTFGVNILDRVYITLGAYIRLGVILPYHLVMSAGILGPDLDVVIIPDKLNAYLHMSLFKAHNSTEHDFPFMFGTAFIEGGLTYYF